MKPGPIHITLWRKYGLTLQESNISAPVSKGKGVWFVMAVAQVL